MMKRPIKKDFISGCNQFNHDEKLIEYHRALEKYADQFDLKNNTDNVGKYRVVSETRMDELEQLENSANLIKVGSYIEKTKQSNPYMGRMSDGWNESIKHFENLLNEEK